MLQGIEVCRDVHQSLNGNRDQFDHRGCAFGARFLPKDDKEMGYVVLMLRRDYNEQNKSPITLPTPHKSTSAGIHSQRIQLV